MLAEILANIAFELKIRIRSLSSYIYFLMFFSLGLLMALAAGGAISGASVNFGTGAKVFVNAPMTITFYIAFLTAFNLFIIAPVFGQAICKVFIHNMDQIVFSSPLKIRSFLIGRFLGAALFMLFVLSSIPLGVFVATQLSLLLPSMQGPNTWKGYIVPFLTIAPLNIFIFGSLFYWIGSKTKKMAPIYIAATLLFLLWSASGQLVEDVDNKVIRTLIDPLGISSLGETTRYWTVHQQSYEFLRFESYFLWNRLLWSLIAIVALVTTLFSFSKQSHKKTAKKKTTVILQPPTTISTLRPLNLSHVQWFPVLLKQLRFEFSQTVKSIYFLVIILAGIGYMFIAGSQMGKMFGTKTFPVTYNVLDVIGGTFSLFILIIITLYTGETIWRDRDLKINQIIDALPVPNAVLFAAKYINLVIVTAVLLTTVLFSGVIIQLAYGYTHFEFLQYFTRLYLIALPSYINVISLNFFLQVVLRNKYAAHGAIVLYYLFNTFSKALGFEHFLYLFNKKPDPIFSDMNRYGHVFNLFHIYNTYWLFLSVIMVIVSYLLWQRGTDNKSLKTTIPQIPRSMNGRLKFATVFAAIGFVSFGSYIFYQSNVVNEYLPKKELEARALDYEKTYKHFQKKSIPDLLSVKAAVDIYPEDLKVSAKLDLTFKNNSSAEIEELLVNVVDNQWVLTFSVPSTITRDERLHVVIYKFTPALQVGQEFTGEYTANVNESTIKNGGALGKIFYNGTFFNNFDYFPEFGYSTEKEISDRKMREKLALAPKLRKPSIHDKEQLQFNLFGPNGHWIDFEATVSTSADQIAIAPGYLQKEWMENGRRYFHYKMDHKILNFYAFLSARYEVFRDKWNDVNIEIYYHKGHEYNLERMVKATKKSLDYFTKNFGPYQHKQYRIIEFPRYALFAQSFPNTIPYSEGIGFIADIDDSNEEDIDYPFYITAHELAHQWWPHQMIGANVQGSDMLSESLSQYSALMVMEKEYGREKMKKFLQYELDRYLFGRGQETEYENPLYLAEDQQYLHYRKGSVIFYSLKDYLGEETLNAALRESLHKFSRMAPPYMTAIDMLDVIKSNISEEKKQLVADMFENIVIFENRPILVEATPLDNDTYKVAMTISSNKLYSSKDGKEETKDFAQEMDIGVLDKDKKYLYLKKHLIKSGETKIEVVVKGAPVKAGVDPLNVLIDRDSDDNITNVVLLKPADKKAL